MPDVDDVEGRQDCEGVVRSGRETFFGGGVRHGRNPTHILVARAFSLQSLPVPQLRCKLIQAFLLKAYYSVSTSARRDDPKRSSGTWFVKQNCCLM